LKGVKEGRKKMHQETKEGHQGRKGGRQLKGGRKGGWGVRRKGTKERWEKNKIGKFGSQVPFYWGKIKVK
jgi:hypothetical protein